MAIRCEKGTIVLRSKHLANAAEHGIHVKDVSVGTAKGFFVCGDYAAFFL